MNKVEIIRENQVETTGNEVRITDIDIPFERMVVIAFKWTGAMLIVGIPFAVLLFILWIIVIATWIDIVN